MSLFKLYLLLILLPDIKLASFFLLGVSLMWIALVLLYWSDEEVGSIKRKYLEKWMKLLGALIVCSAILYLALPNQRDLYKMYALHYVTSNSNFTQLPVNAAKYLNSELTRYIKNNEGNK